MTFTRPPKVARLCMYLGLFATLTGCNYSALHGQKATSPQTTTMKSGAMLVEIPAGEFMMGNAKLSLTRPIHRVKISRFYMLAHEVTNKDFERFRKLTRGELSPGDNHPVTNVSHHDAREYAKWLSKLDGVEYDLPTEAQWEYAARDGLEGKDYPWGDDQDLTRMHVKGEKMVDVGSYPPTKFGLYEIVGNAGELILDSDYDYSNETVTDPCNMGESESTVVRGLGINSYMPWLWMRLSRSKSSRVYDVGFRLATSSEIRKS